MNPETKSFEKLTSMIQDNKFAMMTTVSPDGTIHSRPMDALSMNFKNFDGTLWFFSKRNSFKNHDIESDQNVNLSYANPDKHNYVSVQGKAFVSEDKKKMQELWNPVLKAWFPGGLEDPDISLIGVNVESAEIWDSPSSAVAHALGFVKRVVTGKTYDQRGPGQHHIELASTRRPI
jgi:general stress protein 26